MPIRWCVPHRTSCVSRPDTMFASSTVPRHLLRGAVGLPLMIAAFVLIPLVGFIIWVVKVQGAMNRRWEASGAI